MHDKLAIVYHWWNDRPIGVWEDFQNPVLASIATLRGYNESVPIYVIDTSHIERFWGSFPERLNFRVIKIDPMIPILERPELEICLGGNGCLPNYRLLSRPFDIEWLGSRIRENILCHVESDIFWLDDPVPLQNAPIDHFHFNFYNSGFWYYNRRSEYSQRFFRLWKHFILLGMCNREFQGRIMESYPWGQFQDEAVMCFCARNFHQNYSIPDSHNQIVKKHLNVDEFNHGARNLHFIGQEFPSNRGLIPLLIDRFYASVSRALEPELLALLFGLEYQEFAGKYKISDLVDLNLANFKRFNDQGKQRIREAGRMLG